MKMTLVILSCITLAPCFCLAEDAPPRHNCVRPVHPKAEALKDPTVAKSALPRDHDFSTQVDRYKACIWKFVVAEKKAAQLHTAAADAAVDEWYAFIRESIASGALREGN